MFIMLSVCWTASNSRASPLLSGGELGEHEALKFCVMLHRNLKDEWNNSQLLKLAQEGSAAGLN